MPFSVIKEVKRVSKKQKRLEKTQEKLIEVEIEIGSQGIKMGKDFAGILQSFWQKVVKVVEDVYR